MSTVFDAVDVHAHFVPAAYRAALLAAGMETPDGSPIPPWSVSAHLERLDELQLGTAMLSLSSPGLDFDGRPSYWAQVVNDVGAGLVTDHPDRFGWFASLPLPDIDASLVEIDRAAAELHADGFALLTHYSGSYLGDPRFDPVMSELDRRRAVVFVHPTSPAGCAAVDCGRPAPLIEYLFDTTRAVINLLLNRVFQRYPGIRWVVPHNGAALAAVTDRVQLFADHILHSEGETVEAALARLYFEVGSSAPFPRAGASLLGLASPERLLLGTDLPYAPPPAVAANLTRLRDGELVKGAALAALLGGNARQLFARLAQLRDPSH